MKCKSLNLCDYKKVKKIKEILICEQENKFTDLTFKKISEENFLKVHLKEQNEFIS